MYKLVYFINLRFQEIFKLLGTGDGLYYKIQTPNGTNRNSPFHRGPVQEFNNSTENTR